MSENKDLLECPRCGAQVRKEDRFCSRCGLPLKGLQKRIPIKRAVIGPHPVWLIISGIMFIVFGFVMHSMSATVIPEHRPSVPEFFDFIPIVLIVVGMISIALGIMGKTFPMERIEFSEEERGST